MTPDTYTAMKYFKVLTRLKIVTPTPEQTHTLKRLLKCFDQRMKQGNPNYIPVDPFPSSIANKCPPPSSSHDPANFPAVSSIEQIEAFLLNHYAKKHVNLSNRVIMLEVPLNEWALWGLPSDAEHHRIDLSISNSKYTLLVKVDRQGNYVTDISTIAAGIYN
jgi:hypothetical protein